MHCNTESNPSLERECQRALELQLSLSLLEVQLQDWEGIAALLGPERAQKTTEELTLVLRGTLRATDLFIAQGAGTFLILLLGTISADAPTVVQNVHQAIQGFRLLSSEGAPVFLKLPCKIACATLPDDGESWAQLRLVLEQRLREDCEKPERETPTLRLVG